MPVNFNKLGPGTLKLGAAGVMNVSAQITGCKITPTENVTTRDAIKTLTHETIAAEDTVTHGFTLDGKLVQDISAAGIIAWSYANKGLWMDFEFIPNTVAARKVTGKTRVVPLLIGGDDIEAVMESDFGWAIQGTPVFAAAP